MDVVALFARALDQFGERVAAVKDDQWNDPTPCTDWDVRALTNHVINEVLWMPPLFEGKTIEQVGDRFDGDQLGDNAQTSWKKAQRGALDAVSQPGALEKTVHLSFGDFPGRVYLGQVTSDLVIHCWDLARGIDGDDRLDPELVSFVIAELGPQVEAWRSAGALESEVPVAADADEQTKLLAMAGRKA
ncbi:MAG: TIGR03086 family metal-binding protein [Actinomycetota bacterium]|nr:TIGR03086 family metal-binding protein [Actinomycetota bacterium]